MPHHPPHRPPSPSGSRQRIGSIAKVCHHTLAESTFRPYTSEVIYSAIRPTSTTNDMKWRIQRWSQYLTYCRQRRQSATAHPSKGEQAYSHSLVHTPLRRIIGQCNLMETQNGIPATKSPIRSANMLMMPNLKLIA